MRRRRLKSNLRGIRLALACASALAIAVCTGPAFAASLLPDGFFDRVPNPGNSQAAIAADYLSQDGNGIVTARGQVDMTYLGYYAMADKLIFNQRTKDILLVGNVVMRDPDGTEYAADRVEVTGGFKKAVLNSMVLVTTDGAMITSERTDYDDDALTILEKGTYSPCGECIDEKGRKIGWRVRTQRIIRDEENDLVDLEQPVVEVLGYPVAWLPWMRLPDPSNPRANGFRLPSYGYTDQTGVWLTFPYFYAAAENTDVLLTPTLVARQGVLLGGEVTQHFETGKADLYASGIYQLDPGAFSGQVGDRRWRGAIQTTGAFTPAENWRAGWSYTAFTDAAYLKNYEINTASSTTNQVYATYLTPETFVDVRVQDYEKLGNYRQADQNKQASAIPSKRFVHVQELGAGNGRIKASGDLLGVHRAADSTTTANGVPYVLGYAETKVHGNVEAGWEKQWASPQGVLLTPYLGLRADAAYYNGASAMTPGEQRLLALTPIAAIDARYPLMAVDGDSTHVVEPIAQLAYRGTGATKTGITNDNAQSFVFDDSNLFSYNRFSGTDRQETGLRANVGAQYTAEFGDGSYFDIVAGQSFQIAGRNAYGVNDAAQVGASTGLGATKSHVVIGARAGVADLAAIGGKVQIDPAAGKVTRAAAAGSFSKSGWSLALDYSYLAADPALGSIADAHDAGGSVRVPIDDYWYANLAAGWDIDANRMIDHSASLTYDDGYLEVTGSYKGTGLPFQKNNWTTKLSFSLKGADGSSYGTN